MARPRAVAHDREVRVAVLVVLAGCVAYDETVHVQLHDPDAVAVSAQTPAGERMLLAQGSHGNTEVPAAEPPYLREGTRAGSLVLRGEGPLLATCPTCAWDESRTIVVRTGTGGELEMPGSPDRISRSGDTLRMRYAYVAPVHCHRGGGLCEHELFELLLDTPRDNVERIDYSKRVATAHGELTGAKIGLVTGILFAGLGLAGITYFDIAGEAPNTTAKEAVAGVGGAFILVGGLFAVVGASTLRAQDSDERVPVP